jgi:hypothetical protein
MPFIWNSSPNIPAANLPQPTGPTQISTEAHVVANTVEAGGTLLYNTAAVGFDVIYEVPTLNVGNLSVANLQGGIPPLLNVSPILYNVATGTVSHLSSGVTPGSYGGAAIVPSLVVNATGHISSLTNTTILLTGDNLISNGNGSLFIGNTLTGRFDTRPITPGTGVLVNNDKGEITLVATGDPILSGHRYGSAWISTLDQLPSSNFAHLTSVAYGGALNRYVAVGINELEPANSGFSITSPDAINWSTKNFIPANLLKMVWTGYLFVGVGENGLVMTSPDGITWTQRAAYAGTWYGVAWNGYTLAAIGPTNKAMTSSDGINWTSQTHTGGSGFKDITWFAGIFVAVGDGGKMMTSPDGATWTNRATGGDPFQPATALACVTSGSTVVVAAGIGFIQYSANGIVYMGTPYPGGFTGGAEALTFGAGTYVGVGVDVMTSADGITWTDRTPAVSGQMFDVIYANGLFVAVGRWVMTSPDGITWTNRYVNPIPRQAIAWNGSTFAAVTGDGVRTSPDGAAWTLHSALASDWRSVAWGGAVFAAVGTSSVMTSPDGITWTGRTSVAGSWQSIAWNGTVFAAVGPSIVQTSPDGITWTARSSVAGSWSGITWNGLVFVAVGPSIVQTSPDGITWTSRTTVSGSWVDVSWNGAVFAAVGTNIAMTSPDGNVWTSRATVNGSWVAIEWDGSVFAAVGSDGRIMTSPDGLHWTQRTNAPSGIWQDLAWSGNVFAVVSGDANSNTAIMTNHYDAVTSVAGRVGRVILNTNDVSENAAGPLYFTNERARLALSNTFPISYDTLTGIFGHANSGVTAASYGSAAAVAVVTVDVRGHVTNVVGTPIAISSSVISESAGGPFFHTAARVRGNVSNTAPINYDATTGIFSHALSGVTATTYGNTSFVPVTTVNSTGHVTSVVNTAIVITSNAVTATLTSDNAGANNLGAFLSVVGPTGGVTAPVTTDVYTNVCSMIVEAGDWDMEGSLELSVGATTAATRLTGGVSLTTNAIDISNAGGFMAYQTAAFVVSQKYIFPTGRRRISLSAATRVNLVGALTFTTLGGATWGANSFLSARRTR